MTLCDAHGNSSEKTGGVVLLYLFSYVFVIIVLFVLSEVFPRCHIIIARGNSKSCFPTVLIGEPVLRENSTLLFISNFLSFSSFLTFLV